MSIVENKINIETINSVSSDFQMVLEQLHAIVYVCNLENNRILYMNNYAKNVYGDAIGKVCWESFQKEGKGLCTYCSNDYLGKDKNKEHVLIRDHFNAFDEKWYEVQDKVIFWTNGEKVKLQVAYNIDHRKEDEKKLMILYRQQELFSKIALAFNQEDAFANKVNVVIGLVGNFVGLSRVSIFENQYEENQTKLTYEWCNEGITPKINRMPIIRYSSAHPFYSQIISENLLDASDLEEEIYQSPFAIFRKFDVRAMLLIPVYLHGRHTGFVNFEMCNQIRIWQKDEIQLLKTFGNIVSTSFERKNLEEKRIRIEHNLRDANATKDKFFSIITNNLLTPFSDLTSLSSILLDNYPKWDDDKRIKFIKSIRESSKHGFKLLENLMTWSKMQSGHVEFYQQRVDIKSVINLALEQLNEKAEAKNIIISGAPETFIFVYADYLMLNTIFKNLINNAIKFTPLNGHISIGLRELDDFIEVSISDNGIGIEKAYLNSLFRIDLDNSSFGPPEEKGTGLGLIICHEFVQKHGGQIWVESEIGVGTCFKFTIPRFKE